MRSLLVMGLLLAIQVPCLQAAGIGGQLVDGNGNAIAGAVVEVAGQRSSSGSDGRFNVQVGDERAALLRIEADGYYGAIHAFAMADLDAAGGDVGTITLVSRKPGRRLLLFAGDAMLARRYFEPPDGEAVLVRHDRVLQDGKAILGTIRPYIELADFASVNMETQLSRSQPSNRLPKSVTFFSPPEFAELLEWAGFDYVALGNNHTWDYQREGLEATIAALDQTSLGYSGAGFDEVAARAAFVAGLDDNPVAFLSYVGWAGTFSPHQAAEGDKGGAALGGPDVFAADLAAVAPGTATVLQYHSGLEYSEEPAMSERTRLRLAVDNGADVAVGHHAHVLQGLEIYRGRLIAYSMGNFLFDQTYSTTQLGMLLYVWMDGEELHRAEVVPLYVNGYVPTPATGAMRYSVLHRLARVSRSLGTCLYPNGAQAVVAACELPGTRLVEVADAQTVTGPVPTARFGVGPTDLVSFRPGDYRYRLGTDILRRGDFESDGLWGIPGRGWIGGPAISVADGESRHLRIVTEDGEITRTGMSAFQRVFSPSNPTTLAGRVRADAPATVRFRLQRRRPGMSTSEALHNGPLRTVGTVRAEESGWQRFAIDFDQPRVGANAVRLLIEVSADAGASGTVEVLLDDLAWIEWRSPWLDGTDAAVRTPFATHVEFRRKLSSHSLGL
ncbi:MAG: CapA family protein [Woeseiaceae bacterium]